MILRLWESGVQSADEVAEDHTRAPSGLVVETNISFSMGQEKEEKQKKKSQKYDMIEFSKNPSLQFIILLQSAE